MKPFLFLYIILMVLGLTGCRSQNIDTARDLNYALEHQWMQYRLDSILQVMRSERKELATRLSNLSLGSRTVFYSRPDSIGSQYPLIVFETHANRRDEESTKTNTRQEAALRELRAEASSVMEHKNTSLKEQQKVAKMTWWNLHKWEVCVFVMLLIVVGYMVYKLKR